ncbi:MAG: flagellar hook-length control protein FliK, partial [Planctomycetales bacterium]|nr:flagellar hook-length control protein FliK [Planctomycetales bacterium]
KNTSDSATAPVGKKRSPKVDRTDRPQRKTEEPEQSEEQARSQAASAPASDASQDPSPMPDEADVQGDQAVANGDEPPAVDSASDQTSGENIVNAQLPTITGQPVDAATAPVERDPTQAVDPSAPTNGEPQVAQEPAVAVIKPVSTGDGTPHTLEGTTGGQANSSPSAAETDAGQTANSEADPIVAIDGQTATQASEPKESSGDGGEKSKNSHEEYGSQQTAADVQAPTLPGSDTLTNPNAQNSTTPPPVVPTDAPPSSKDAPQPPSGSSQSTAGIQPNPNRLPQHLLTRSESHHGHNPAPVPVDSARFLSRVAKAFTAAQQRDGEVRLRLSPPELGSLRLQVSVQDGVMVARMETETEAAKAQLTNNLPALRERLAEQGIRVERFDIDLMQHASTGTPDRPNDPQQQPEPQPFRSLRTNQSSSEVPSPSISSGNWNGQGRLNVII